MSLATEDTDFLIGAATAAHQIEGNNNNSDWWKYWNQMEGAESPGIAADSYELYQEDRKLLQDINANCYRFSISWAKIEPKQGVFDQEVIDHYIEQIDDLLEHGIEPFVTLHHFVNPAWFEDQISWTDSESVDVFMKFVNHVVPYFKGKVKYFVTINEPNIYSGGKYLAGVWFPKAKSPIKFYQSYSNLLRAHKEAYLVIKENIPDSSVSVCMQDFSLTPHHDDGIVRVAEEVFGGIKNHISTDWFYSRAIDHMDYLALNFYAFRTLNLNPSKPSIYPDSLGISGDQLEQDPDELEVVITKYYNKFKLPIMITENGTPAGDKHRVQYLEKVFQILNKLRKDDDVELMGYLYWSLLDNYEWHLGYSVGYGLFTIDRKPRESSKFFASQVERLFI